MKFLVLLPAVIHVYVFVLESFLWGKPRTNQTFGLRLADVEATRPFAFNQGVYNLLLAVAVFAGWSLWMGVPTFDKGPFAGQVLMVYGLGSIAIAGLTLLASSPKLWRSALVQLVPALAGLIAVFYPGA
jgi:putative membrane protein